MLSSAEENPAYCLMGHGLPAYIVALGPLKKGGKPGYESKCSKPFKSSSVYRDLKVILLCYTTNAKGLTQYVSAIQTGYKIYIDQLNKWLN